MYEVSKEFHRILARDFRNPGHARLEMYINGAETATVFNDDVIISAECERSFSQFCMELPTVEFSVTIFDYEHVYDVDDDNSPVYTMTPDTKLVLHFGMELDDGTTEWVPMATGYLAGVVSQSDQVTFKATDSLRLLNGLYYHGGYVKQTQSANYPVYLAFVDVMNDAGTNVGNVSILRRAFADRHVPVPVVPYKEAMQLLANSQACSLRIARDDSLSLVDDVEALVSDETREIIDFYLSQHEYYNPPKITRKQGYSVFQVSYHTWRPQLTDGTSGAYVYEQIMQGTYTLAPGAPMEFVFDKKYYRYSLYFEPTFFPEEGQPTPVVSIVDSGISYLKIDTDTEGEYNVWIKGNPLIDTVETVGKDEVLSANGKNETWDNPSQTSVYAADELRRTLLEFGNPEVTYTLTTRGDPEIDPGDIIHQPCLNNENDAWIVLVLKNKVTFNGAFRGELVTMRMVKDAGYEPIKGYSFYVTGVSLMTRVDDDGYGCKVDAAEHSIINESAVKFKVMSVVGSTLVLS